MTMEHTVNHLGAVSGLTLAVYALWSMLLSPTQGPLPGTVLPVIGGFLLFAVGAVMLGWGLYRIYGYE